MLRELDSLTALTGLVEFSLDICAPYNSNHIPYLVPLCSASLTSLYIDLYSHYRLTAAFYTTMTNLREFSVGNLLLQKGDSLYSFHSLPQLTYLSIQGVWGQVRNMQTPAVVRQSPLKSLTLRCPPNVDWSLITWVASFLRLRSADLRNLNWREGPLAGREQEARAALQHVRRLNLS